MALACCSNATGWRASRAPLLASGTNRVFGLLQTLFARVSPWCLCRVQDETSLPALHCGGESFSKFPLLRGELCPASIVASIVWLQMQRQSATPGFDSVLYSTRIRHGNRSLSEPRSKAKSAQPTPIVAFCHNTTNFTKPRYLYRVCAAKEKKKKKKNFLSNRCPIGRSKNMETASAGGRERIFLLLLAWPRLSSGSDAEQDGFCVM